MFKFYGVLRSSEGGLALSVRLGKDEVAVSFSVVASYMALYDQEFCFVGLAEVLGLESGKFAGVHAMVRLPGNCRLLSNQNNLDLSSSAATIESPRLRFTL
jgi:hypothetical protein